jgi:hypothetical protein
VTLQHKTRYFKEIPHMQKACHTDSPYSSAVASPSLYPVSNTSECSLGGNFGKYLWKNIFKAFRTGFSAPTASSYTIFLHTFSTQQLFTATKTTDSVPS